MVKCPCCGYDTLTVRSKFEDCYLCGWEDDGQDDHNANEIFGGPNLDYSLTEARENFKKYYTFSRWGNPLMYFQEFEEVIGLKRKLIAILEVLDTIDSDKTKVALDSELEPLKEHLDKIESESWKLYRKQGDRARAHHPRVSLT